jgi:hypothetical protein
MIEAYKVDLREAVLLYPRNSSHPVQVKESPLGVDVKGPPNDWASLSVGDARELARQLYRLAKRVEDRLIREDKEKSK